MSEVSNAAKEAAEEIIAELSGTGALPLSPPYDHLDRIAEIVQEAIDAYDAAYNPKWDE